MTGPGALWTLVAACLGAFASGVAGVVLVRRAPERLMRVNVRGVAVPAVLGGPLVVGGLLGAACIVVASKTGGLVAVHTSMALAVAVLLVVIGAGGHADDRRGDEPARGFRGHLQAASEGRLTGGMVKIATGAFAGIVAAVLVTDDLEAAMATALIVALSANLLNLFDRAPGRAGKVALLLLVPALGFAPATWAAGAAGTIAAFGVTLTFDLKERAMLGDAGANPLGAVIGLGLALALPSFGRWVLVAALLAVTALSERVSFSRVIERNAWLTSIDRWGRA